MSDLLTVEDAAGRAQVHPETVKRAIRSGRLRASRLGERGAYRIREEWFDEWIDGQSVALDASADDRRRGAVRGSRTRGRLAVGEGMGKVA
jgi:excisionase family DNA binding protein